MHLAWFIGRGCSVHGWNQPWSSLVGSDWINPDIYLDLVRALDRACFDYVVIEDGSFVPDAFRGSSEWYLRNAFDGAKERPHAARAATRPGEPPARHRGDDDDGLLPALSRRSPRRHVGPPDAWPYRAEPGHRAQR